MTAWLCAIAPVRAEVCVASWYGRESGRVTASGERFHPPGLTAAHRSLPFGARLRVSLHSRSVGVRINDRGPAAWTGRCLDLSQGAARALRMRGVARVKIQRLK
jgi:rare lipoprotein A